LLEEINRILAESGIVKGYLVYKWVLNKVGKRYWYWYLHVREGNRTRSIYIGKEVPQNIIRGIAARRKVRDLERQLREIAERRLEIERLVATAL